MTDQQVPSSIKDQNLVEKRRNQMIKGAVSLFIEKGFHKTTTREIAKASGKKDDRQPGSCGHFLFPTDG